MAGALDATARATVLAHLDGCADCRDLLTLLARDATRDAAFDTLRGTEEPPAKPELTETQESVPGVPQGRVNGDQALGATEEAPDPLAPSA